MPDVQLSQFHELGVGPSAQMLFNYDFDLGILRPWCEKFDLKGRQKGPSYVTVNTGRTGKDGAPIKENITVNSPALFRREDWLRIDTDIQWAMKLQLRFWNDLRGTNPYIIPDGLSTIVLQHTVADGDADAVLSMDGMRKSEKSRPVLDVGHLPLPICHSDNSFSLREVAVSRRSGMPLDTTAKAMAGRKIGEVLEKLALGLLPPYTYGVGTIYGARNMPQRHAAVITSPLTGGWTPQTTYNEVLGLLQVLRDDLFPGPYAVYLSPGWARYAAQDYNATYPVGTTLARKLTEIEDIATVRTVQYLPDYEILIIQMTPDVAQAVDGMPLTNVQWEAGGGMEICLKTMTIGVPRFRANYRGQCGILQAVGTLGGTTTTTTTTTSTTTTTTTTTA